MLVWRLRKEFLEIQNLKPHGIQITIPGDELNLWEAVIPGPTESLYKGGSFKIQITIPEKYPLEPPVLHFKTPIYHLNVSQTWGQVCLGFLAQDSWLPSSSILDLLNAVYALLIRPEEDNAFDHDVSNNYHHFRWTYDNTARSSAVNAKATL